MCDNAIKSVGNTIRSVTGAIADAVAPIDPLGSAIVKRADEQTKHWDDTGTTKYIGAAALAYATGGASLAAEGAGAGATAGAGASSAAIGTAAEGFGAGVVGAGTAAAATGVTEAAITGAAVLGGLRTAAQVATSARSLSNAISPPSNPVPVRTGPAVNGVLPIQYVPAQASGIKNDTGPSPVLVGAGAGNFGQDAAELIALAAAVGGIYYAIK